MNKTSLKMVRFSVGDNVTVRSIIQNTHGTLRAGSTAKVTCVFNASNGQVVKLVSDDRNKWGDQVLFDIATDANGWPLSRRLMRQIKLLHCETRRFCPL